MPVINPILETGVPPADGPCDWLIDVTCVENWDTFPPTVQAAAQSWATYILWALTGRQFGACPVTVRPCGPKCQGPNGYLTFPVNAGASGAGFPWMVPWIDNGVWRNCGCAGGCTCSADCEVRLLGPVAGIEEVRVDGIVLDPTAYRLDFDRATPVLVRTDGECWPECQDMNAGTDEVGSFAVTYLYGTAVPMSGRLAAGMLAGEFAKACAGAECALPQQLASLTRNGVDVQVVDPTSFLEDGLTGIANVDLWIRAVNPARRPQRSRVFSPDITGPRISL